MPGTLLCIVIDAALKGCLPLVQEHIDSAESHAWPWAQCLICSWAAALQIILLSAQRQGPGSRWH